MKRRGFFYATFAIFLLGLISISILIPLDTNMTDRSSTNLRIDELYFFTESVQDDIERAAAIIGRRSLVAATNGVVENETGLDQPSYRIAEAFLNGTIAGNTSQLMTDSTFPDWITSMEQQAAAENYDINISTGIDQVNLVQAERFSIRFIINHSFAIEDTSINTGFDDGWRQADQEISIEGVDDALLIIETGGRRYNSYKECEAVGASHEATGMDSEYNYTSNGAERTWASGDAFQFNGTSLNGIEEQEEHVLITDDLCDYEVDELKQFNGVVSEATTDGQNVCGSGEEIDAYIGGIDDKDVLENRSRIVMNEEDVWHQHIPSMIDNRCYFPDSGGPSFLGRLAGNYTADNQGMGSILDIPDLPPEQQESGASPIDHIYFDPADEADTLHQVKGVSNHQEWFVLDERHIEQWNMSAMTY